MADCTGIQAQIDSQIVTIAEISKPNYCREQYPDDLNDRKTCQNSIEAQISDAKAVLTYLTHELALCAGFLGSWYWRTFINDFLGFTHLVHQRLDIDTVDQVPRLWSGTLTTRVDGSVVGPDQPETISFGTIDVTTLQVQFQSNIGTFTGQFATNVSQIDATITRADGTFSLVNATHDPNNG
jgi:hypothetical protein